MYNCELVKRTLDKFLSTVAADDFIEGYYPSEIVVDMGGGKMINFIAWNCMRLDEKTIITYQSEIPNALGNYVNIDIVTRYTKRKYKGGYRRIFDRSVVNGCNIY